MGNSKSGQTQTVVAAMAQDDRLSRQQGLPCQALKYQLDTHRSRPRAPPQTWLHGRNSRPCPSDRPSAWSHLHLHGKDLRKKCAEFCEEATFATSGEIHGAHSRGVEQTDMSGHCQAAQCPPAGRWAPLCSFSDQEGHPGGLGRQRGPQGREGTVLPSVLVTCQDGLYPRYHGPRDSAADDTALPSINRKSRMEKQLIQQGRSLTNTCVSCECLMQAIKV